MDADYAGSTIRQTYIIMGSMLKAAKMNDLILKHPMDGIRYTKPVRATNDIKFLTREEQSKFLQAAQRSHNYSQYALILETGLRTGEMIGLTWDAIDFEKRTLTVNKTLEFRHGQKVWRAGPPKTQQSYRTIPLTTRAYAILKELWNQHYERKESPLLAQTLEYIDRRTGAPAKLIMRDLVFINWRTGEPTKNSSYDTHLYKLCDEAGIKRFCMLPCATHTPHAQSSAACSPKFSSNYWGTPASKRRWIAMSMSRRIRSARLSANSNPFGCSDLSANAKMA